MLTDEYPTMAEPMRCEGCDEVFDAGDPQNYTTIPWAEICPDCGHTHRIEPDNYLDIRA